MKKLINTKKVYMYDTKGNLLRVFDTTFDCAEYFDKTPQYIYYNLKYFKKIWNKAERKWYVIKRS